LSSNSIVEEDIINSVAAPNRVKEPEMNTSSSNTASSPTNLTTVAPVDDFMSLPLTCRSPAHVVVDAAAPILTAVAAPKALTVVGVALRRLKVLAVEVISPPFTAISPATVKASVLGL